MRRRRSGVALLVTTGLSFAVLAPVLPVAAAVGDPTITSSPPSPGQSRSISWSFTGGGQISCRLTGPGAFDTAYVDCANTASYTLDGQPDGTYTFAVRNQPASSNNGEVGATSTYVLDTQAAVTITSSPPSPGNQNSVGWGFVAEPGAITSCQLQPPGQPAPGFTSCVSGAPYTVDTDGTYTFTVQATDGLGNTGPPASATFTRDSAPPAPPTITAEPPTPTATTAVSWAFTAPDSDSATCQLSLDGLALGAFAPCVSGTVFTLTQDGTYVFSVRALDGAGNVSDPTPSSPLVADLSAPLAPAIILSPGSAGRNTSPSWSFSAEAGASLSCQLNPPGPNPAGFVPCSSPAVYTLTTDGAYTFSVQATDGFGRLSPVASAGYTLDRAAPPLPAITNLASPQADNTPIWEFTAEPGAVPTCQLLRGMTVVASGCTSPTSAGFTLPADGTYTFSVFVTDLAGNASPTAPSADYVLDTTGPPPPSVTAGPAAISRDANPQWTFTVETGATTICQITGPGTGAAGFAPCSSPAAYALTTDGTFDFSVQAFDGLGNSGGVTTVSFTLDRTAPAAPVITPIPSPGTTTTPTWAFAAEDGATATCELTRGTTVISSDCSSPRSATYTVVTDGTYTFSVRVSDAAGNMSPAAISSYVLDRVAPAAPVIDSGPVAGTDAAVSWTFNAESGATTFCRLTQGATVISALAICTSPFATTLPGDGSYTFLVYATDAAGNAGSASTATYERDTVSPGRPAVSGPTSPGRATDVTWSYSVEPGTTARCQLTRNGSILQPLAPCPTAAPATPTSAFSTLTDDGTYVFSVVLTDAAGNTGPAGSAVYVLDRVAPSAPTITSPPSPSNDPTPTWTISAPEVGAAAECAIGPAASVEPAAFRPCDSPISHTAILLADDSYQFVVRFVDAAGNTGPAGSAVYVLDRVAPSAPTITSPPSPSSDPTPTWTISAPEVGAAAECAIGPASSVVPAAFSPCDSPISHTAILLADGNYQFLVRFVDAAGNTGPAAAALPYVLDRLAPAVPTITSAPPPLGNDTNPAWAFTAEAGARVTCQLSLGVADPAAFAPCPTPTTASYAIVSGDGSYTFSVRATDAAGNTGPAATRTYTLDTSAPAAPRITAAPTGTGTQTAVVWRFTAEAGATVVCQLLQGRALIFAAAPCTSPMGQNLPSDGDFVFSVYAVDRAGNVGPSSTATYTRDTGAPEPPVITTAPSTPASLTTVTWEFISDAANSLACQLSRNGMIVRPFGPCSSAASATYGLSGDGGYTFSVRATDPAGNTGASASADYVLDTIAPGAPAIGPRSTSGADPNPSWSFTTEPGASAMCRLVRGLTVVADWAGCSGGRAYDLSNEPAGVYVFSVRAIDAAGNVGPASSASYAWIPLVSRAAPSDLSSPFGPERSSIVSAVAPGLIDRATQALVAASRPEPKAADQAPGDLPAPTPPPAELDSSEQAVVLPGPPRSAPDGVADTIRDVGLATVKKTAFPFFLLVIVLLFLLIQDRIDRRDPKLALAPVYRDPDLDFAPPPSRRRSR